MKNRIPYIGISGNFNEESGQHLLAKTYVNALLKAGACPVILPPCSGESLTEELIDKTLSQLDGIVFSGGGDFTPELIGEERIEALGSINPLRDKYEFPLIRKALALQLPILGICRGEQLLNLALGGRIYQDLPSEFPGAAPHSQSEARELTTHSVQLLKGSLLETIFKGKGGCSVDCGFGGARGGERRIAREDASGESCDDLSCGLSGKANAGACASESFPNRMPDEGIGLHVNSFHHQAVKTLGKGLRVSAWSSDGVTEAIESTEYKPIIGVQWHPECLVDTRPEMQALFQWLCQEAQLYRETRDCLEKSVSIDLHCDAPMFFEGNYDLLKGGNIERGKIDFDAQGEEALELVDSRVDLQKMQEGGLDSIVMAAYIKQLQRDEAGLKAAEEKARQLLEEVRQRASALAPRCAGVRNAAELPALQAGSSALLLGIENAYALGKDLSLIDEFAQMGVVYITLCHNGHNDICDSASQADTPEHNGLSAFGCEVIKAMNRTGIIIDMSHASEKSFYDALEYSQTPIICSHSSVWTLCHHRRNLKDEQIKALAQKGGMTGICLYGGFLAKDREANIKDAVAHINHVRDLVGIDYVGIGSDFDGGGGITGCNHSGEFFNLVRELLREGYSQHDIKKIVGGNFLRVLNEVQSYAQKHHDA